MATRKKSATAVEEVITVSEVSLQDLKATVNPEPSVFEKMAETTLPELDSFFTEEADDQIANILSNLEKIGEQQEAAVNAEIAELDAKLAESEAIREESLNSFYSEVKMELSQARPVTVKEILMAKEVSTVDATRFTDRFKEVRDAVWALNKKGEREYVIIKDGKVAVFVWRIK